MLGEEVEVYRFCSQLAEWTKGAPCRVELIRGTLETCKVSDYCNIHYYFGSILYKVLENMYDIYIDILTCPLLPN